MTGPKESLVVPSLGESIVEATVSRWLKETGSMVTMDDPLVELETDKVTLEVNAPYDGVLQEIVTPEGDTVKVGDVLGHIEKKQAPSGDTSPPPEPPKDDKKTSETQTEILSPAASKLTKDNELDPGKIKGTGKDGRITKEDVITFLNLPNTTQLDTAAPSKAEPKGSENRVPMSRLRRTVAKRLKDVQNTAAILTTFNDINMQPVMDLRKRYQDRFLQRHDVKIGFMSFFIKAAVAALKEFPAVNAEIQDQDILYKDYQNISIAVSAPQGLVVPVLRDTQAKTFADIEKEIIAFSKKAKNNTLSMEDMAGGTFTITNGGVFGSMMSTPILNPPQSAILGLHKIEKRPVVIDDEIVIRPMMYVALSYDHRIIDGREAVLFLSRIKDCIEDPDRMLIDV